MYVIAGATGNTGKPIAHALLDAGRAVRVIGRSAERLKDFTDKGAASFVGELTDRAAMEKVFAGAEAAYVLVPPKYNAEDVRAYQNQVVDSLRNAVVKNGVKFVITLSSLGADVPDGNGPVAGLFDMEQKFNTLAKVNVLHLRPGYFMENTLGLAGMAKSMGFIGTPMDPHVEFGMIASRDIAAYAAKRLLALDFSGHNHQELQGRRNISYAEIAKVYGAKIGKPDMVCVHLPAEQAITGFMQMGLSRALASSFVELGDAIKSGHVKFREPRNSTNTTATSIEEFADTWAAVYRSHE